MSEIKLTIQARSECSPEFLQGMLARMDVSFHKYGPLKDAYPHKVNALQSMQKRLALYEETGNKEWLMDAANFLMIEFMRPSRKDAHMRATDSDESPGRAWHNGTKTLDNAGNRT